MVLRDLVSELSSWRDMREVGVPNDTADAAFINVSDIAIAESFILRMRCLVSGKEHK